MAKPRKKINLELKIEVLKRFDSGQKTSHIARKLGLAPRTIRTICVRDVNQIRACAKTATPIQSKQITIIKSTIKIQMESLLIRWIENQNLVELPVTKMAIQEKAASLFNEIRGNLPSSNRECLESFEASSNWFHRFKKRSNLQSALCSIKPDSANADDSIKEFMKQQQHEVYYFKPEARIDNQATHLNKNTESDTQFNPNNDSSENPGSFESDPEMDLPVSLVEPVVKVNPLEMVPDVQTLTTAHASKALQLISQAMDIFLENDPDKKRSFKVIRSMADSVNCYKIFLEREAEKIQQTLDNFLNKSSRQPNQPTEMDTKFNLPSLK